MRLLDQLLDRAVVVLPAHLHGRVVIFGSAPMVFAGLKQDVTFDLDLFVDDEAFHALQTAGFSKDVDERGLARIMVAEAVEVVSTWPGAVFEEVFAAAMPREGSRGLRVAALEHVHAFKVNSDREKDRREAEVIRQALRGSDGIAHVPEWTSSSSRSTAPTPTPMLRVRRLDHLTITSSDPERSIRFYTEVLGLERDAEWPQELTMLRCPDGAGCVGIGWWERGKTTASQPAIAIEHFAFEVDRETYVAAREHLERHGVAIDHESDHGICRSLYFRDPDGLLVELACYELRGASDKMPARS